MIVRFIVFKKSSKKVLKIFSKDLQLLLNNFWLHRLQIKIIVEANLAYVNLEIKILYIFKVIV